MTKNITTNTLDIVKVLEENNNEPMTAQEIIDKGNLKKTLQSVNGSASAYTLQGKVFNKSKKQVNDKMKTCYTLTQDYKSYLENENKGE